MNQLLKDNYQAVVDRGLINDKTRDSEFLDKLNEEFQEVFVELVIKKNKNPNKLYEEISDLINVCSCWLIHKNQDPENWLKYILDKNIKRVNNDKI